VRILVTNDDGVHAPGIGVLTRFLAEWAATSATEPTEVVVVAPLANHSGASAAVGTVYERETLAYERVRSEGADTVEAFGLDASPALSVVVACQGAFGGMPDLIVSGINHGVNVGRSVLHSGTVGAVLAGAQLGVRGLAVSLRASPEPLRWETAAATAVALVPVLAASPPGTVFNLNVPSVAPEVLRGLRPGRVGTAGLIKSADHGAAGSRPGPETRGEIHLRLGAAIPRLGDIGDEDPDDDAAVVAAGFAALTALSGVHEDTSPGAIEAVRAALAAVGPTFEPG
jgi:5'-nucleotidase